jgi:hypothetical protein
MKEYEKLSIDHLRDIDQMVKLNELDAIQYLERHGYGPGFVASMMEHRKNAINKVVEPEVTKVVEPEVIKVIKSEVTKVVEPEVTKDNIKESAKKIKKLFK